MPTAFKITTMTLSSLMVVSILSGCGAEDTKQMPKPTTEKTKQPVQIQTLTKEGKESSIPKNTTDKQIASIATKAENSANNNAPTSIATPPKEGAQTDAALKSISKTENEEVNQSELGDITNTDHSDQNVDGI